MCDMHTRPPLLSPTDAIHHFLSCFFCSVPTSIMRTCGPGALLIDRCVRAVCSGVPRLQFTVSVCTLCKFSSKYFEVRSWSVGQRGSPRVALWLSSGRLARTPSVAHAAREAFPFRRAAE